MPGEVKKRRRRTLKATDSGERGMTAPIIIAGGQAAGIAAKSFLRIVALNKTQLI